MIGYYMNLWLAFFYLHPLLNRLGITRKLRWVFRGPDGATIRFTLGAEWGHTAAEVWEWHNLYALPILAGRPGWTLSSAPPEVNQLSGRVNVSA